jgi:TolB protein
VTVIPTPDVAGMAALFGPPPVQPTAPTREPEAIQPRAVPTLQGAAALARGRLIFSSDRTGNQEIYLMGLDGLQARQLTSDPRFDSFWARVSPDRQRILFYRRPSGSPGDDFTQTSLWMISADGSGIREIRPRGTDGWELQGHAEWSPDGRQLVMSGGRAVTPQIYVTDPDGKIQQQVTNRTTMSIDPSWSPDGARIAFIGCAAATCTPTYFEVFTIPVAGGAATQLTNNTLRDHDPYYAPDGRSLAWLSETEPNVYGPGIGVWNILLMAADGTQQRNVTNDRQLNSVPRWSEDGGKIYFHRFELRGNFRWSIFSIQRDGSGLAELTPNAPGNSEYPSP